jgi:hypothetical protein
LFPYTVADVFIKAVFNMCNTAATLNPSRQPNRRRIGILENATVPFSVSVRCSPLDMFLKDCNDKGHESKRGAGAAVGGGEAVDCGVGASISCTCWGPLFGFQVWPPRTFAISSARWHSTAGTDALRTSVPAISACRVLTRE